MEYLIAAADIQKNVVSALDIFWKGMLSIAIVIAVIFLIVVFMNLATKSFRLRKERQEAMRKEAQPKDGPQQ